LNFSSRVFKAGLKEKNDVLYYKFFAVIAHGSIAQSSIDRYNFRFILYRVTV